MTSDPVKSFADRVEYVFHQAWGLDEPDRAAFLIEACRENPPLRQAVDALLNADALAERDPLWNESAIQREARDLAADQGNTRLDRYRLLEQIGAGGMGMVYKAVRADDEYSKVVAIKIVQAGDRALAERLRRERQILADLEHTGIARLLDGGTTEEGLPFLVMEFVDGAPIDRYAADQNLPLRSRLELFSKICRAAAYAHRRLVVHRDLKPGNILVTADGEPKLLDFGIAKALGSEERGLEFAHTPEYASPEQKRGLPATASSDIYSLGVLLGKLIPAQASNPDLRAIVTKATREDPDQRYPGVDLLAEDVRRFTEGFTVLAREQRTAYRIGKFVRRRKWSVTAAAVAASILVAGLAVMWHDRRVSEHRFQEVRRSADTGQFQPGGALSGAAAATAVRGTLNERAVESLERLLHESPGDTRVKRDLATAYQRLALVQGTVFSANVGDRKTARVTMEKALKLREALFAADPANVNDRAALIDTLGYLGRMSLSDGDPAEAYNLHTRAWREAQPLLALGPEPDEPYRAACRLEYLLGIHLGGIGYSANLGDPAAALEHHTHSLALSEQWMKKHPKSDPKLQFALREQIIGVDLMRLGSRRSGSSRAPRGNAAAAEAPRDREFRRPAHVVYDALSPGIHSGGRRQIHRGDRQAARSHAASRGAGRSGSEQRTRQAGFDPD